MEKENIIIQYIAAWNWFNLGIILFVSSFVVINQGGIYGSILFFAFMVGFILCIILSFMRRKRLLDYEKENKSYYDESNGE